MTFLFATLGNVYAQAPALPTLPQKTVSLTQPLQGTSNCPTLTTGANCMRNVASGNATSFQNAINAATCGDTIVLVAGTTYTGNFTIPPTSCSGWIVIESSAVASLPSTGNRVGPSNVSNMATLTTNTGNTPVISVSDKAHNWRFIGLEITATVGSTQNALFTAGASTTVLANIPTQIIIDRCYVHGAATTSIKRGLSFHVAYGAVVDSYINNIFSPGYDSQAIVAWNGPGPYLYQNNFLSAASENTLFGGAAALITNLIPSDITIIGNWYWKDYANWLGAGYAVKNSIEFKMAQRVLVDGNVFDYSWADAQTGNLVSMKSDNSGNCSSCATTDVSFTHNIVRHGSIGVLLALNDGTGAQPLNRVLIQNNLLTDISTTYGSGNGWGFATWSTVPGGGDLSSDNETIDHNTVFDDGQFLILGDSGTIAHYQLTNNLGTLGLYGIKGPGYGVGTASLNGFVPTAVYNDNAFITSDGTLDGATYPTGTFSNTQSGVGFTSVSGTTPALTGNFQLTSGSPYHNAGTDGKDIGVSDWTCLNNDVAAALAGKFVPSAGCAVSVNLLPQPPNSLSATVQ